MRIWSRQQERGMIRQLREALKVTFLGHPEYVLSVCALCLSILCALCATLGLAWPQQMLSCSAHRLPSIYNPTPIYNQAKISTAIGILQTPLVQFDFEGRFPLCISDPKMSCLLPKFPKQDHWSHHLSHFSCCSFVEREICYVSNISNNALINELIEYKNHLIENNPLIIIAVLVPLSWSKWHGIGLVSVAICFEKQLVAGDPHHNHMAPRGVTVCHENTNTNK